MKQAVVGWLIVTVVATTIMFTNLGQARLWDRDEPRNAGCAREMLARGDWITPIFNDELREQKPVLLYWLIMSAYSLFGESEFSARFWSALLAVGTVSLTYLMGRRLFSQSAGIWSAIALSTSLMFVVAGRAATPDSVLIFCSTAALACYVLGTFRAADTSLESQPKNEPVQPDGVWNRAHVRWQRPFPSELKWVVPMFAMMGLAVLAKGPVGFILPMAVIGMFGLLYNQPAWRDNQELGPITSTLLRAVRPFGPKNFFKTLWSMRPLTGLLIVLAIAAPWYILVGIATEGDFLKEFFLKEHFGRATQSFENHDGPIYYYPVSMLIGFFPWSVFAIPILLWLDRLCFRREGRPLDPAIVFCMCWVGVYVGIFTIAQTKLPSYVTPCYPALALIAGQFLAAWPLRSSIWLRRWSTAGVAIAGFVGVAICVALPLVASRLLPGAEWLGVLGAVLIPAALVSGYWLRNNRPAYFRIAYGNGAILFVLGLFGVGTVTVDKYQQVDRLLAVAAPVDGQSQQALASFGVLESSWVFYAKQPILELVPPSDTAPAGSSRDWRALRHRPWHNKPQVDIRQYLSDNEDRLVIMRAAEVETVQAQLPFELRVIETAPYFLEEGESLVIVGRAGSNGVKLAQNKLSTDNSDAPRR